MISGQVIVLRLMPLAGTSFDTTRLQKVMPYADKHRGYWADEYRVSMHLLFMAWDIV